MKLGKKPARPGAVKLKFGDYVNTSILPTPPDSFGHDRMIGDWGMLANDQVGDCAIADALHQHLLWETEAGNSIPLDDDCAIRNYSNVTGYIRGNEATDQGTDVPTLIQHRLNTGLEDAAGNVHKIGAAVELQPGNWEELIYGLYYFDGVTLGINMCEDWMTAFQHGEYAWDAIPYPNIIGGHAITGVAFNQTARIVTWGTDAVNLTQAGYEQACDETFAYFSLDKLRNGVDLEGLDADKLLADLPLLQDIT